MADKILMRIQGHEGVWIQNFHLGGWHIRNEDNTAWIPMTIHNTRISNPHYDEGDADSVKWLKPSDPRLIGV
jgi:hypothetical protein